MKILKISTHIVAIIQMVLGAIHCSFTPVIMKNIPPEISKGFLMMFLATGLAIIYSGIVMLREVKNLKGINRKNLILINVSLVFILLVGLLAVSLMSKNPFAWVSLIVGVAGSAIVFGVQLTNRSTS